MSDLPFLGDLDTGSYRFEDPWLLLAALILPALILVRLVRRPSAEGLGFSRVDAIRRVGGFRRRMRWLPFALRLGAIALLVVAVARPQRGQANASVDAEGIDIALALDISSSMNETDFEQRSRLEVAQDVLRQFVDHQRDDRIGLVAFQEEARVLSPLTLDHDPLVRLITNAGEQQLGDGTAIGLATAEAVNLLIDSRAESRVVVLATDGENNAGAIDPLEAARLAEALGIRVHTIGLIGSLGNQVDEATLESLAELTGGTYNRATSEEGLQEVYDSIADLEKSRVTRERFLTYDELAVYALAAAAGVLVLEALLRATVFRRVP